jgi:hypothetical protein
MDGLGLTDLKTMVGAVIAWIAGNFLENPIGVSTAIVGLLYVFERLRTQRVLRKIAEKDLEEKEK